MATLPVIADANKRATYGSDRHSLEIAINANHADDMDDDDACTASSSSLETSPSMLLGGAGVVGDDSVMSTAASRHHDDVVRELGVDPNYGLSPLSVEERQREHGLNELETEEEVRGVELCCGDQRLFWLLTTVLSCRNRLCSSSWGSSRTRSSCCSWARAS